MTVFFFSLVGYLFAGGLVNQLSSCECEECASHGRPLDLLASVCMIAFWPILFVLAAIDFARDRGRK